MTTTAPPSLASEVPSDRPEYAAEIRFGVVMYGGVSLAIYINGVSSELYEMACATPRTGFKLGREGEASSREVYRRLSWLAGSAELRQQYAGRLTQCKASAGGADPADAWPGIDLSSASRTRLVVDVIAGTSAGGINGVFLAKALAQEQQFGALKDLWVNEGDIGLLLNDSRSYAGLGPSYSDRSAKPSSLLNSDRMYAKLLDAMNAMAPVDVAQRPAGHEGSALADEIDLFVTTTDIEGSAVSLRLFDKVVYERRYKQSYHFSLPHGVSPSGNDFDAVNIPFLAFAARCTSSFPFAFEPMTLAAVARLGAQGQAPGLKRWKAFFPNLPRLEVGADAHEHRAFGDGGYLDNKPFTYVVEALSQRQAGVPIERKLLYVEPSPEVIDPHRLPDPGRAPDAVENSMAALTRIPRYESVREDLQALLQRNRRIERVERMVRMGEIDIEGQTDPFKGLLQDGGHIPPWASLRLSDMVSLYGVAFLPYQRLRVYGVTDVLADRLGARWGIDGDSDHQYALRALVRVWRERGFHDEGLEGRAPINAFLNEFDLDYRLRRLSLLLRKIDLLTRLLRKRSAGAVNTGADAARRPSLLAEAELHLARRLPPPFTNLGQGLSSEDLLSGQIALNVLKSQLLAIRAGIVQLRRGRTTQQATAVDPRLQAELMLVLQLILGEQPGDGRATLSGASPAEQVRVVLDPSAIKMASLARTLQESVVFRARALFTAAESSARTPLHGALESDLEAMRFKHSHARSQGQQPMLNRVSAQAWLLLGEPKLVLDEASGKVVARVADQVDLAQLPDLTQAQTEALNSVSGLALRQFLGEYYLRFDSFDQISFPLYYDTGTGEPATVEVVRVSPADATHLIDESSDKLQRRKLAGTALANFGAFLDRRWRLNDIMWGRLDGAERLIQALLPMSDADTLAVRSALIDQAHRGILREALVPDGQQDLADLLVKALNAAPQSGDTGQRLQALLASLWGGDSVAKDRLGGMLVSLLSEKGLVDYVREKREVDPDPEPKETLRSAARAVTITGRVLEGIAARHDKAAMAPRWLARLGLLLQGIVAVSLPGALRNRWWTHGVKLLYAFEVFALLVAILLGSADMRTLALTALGVTLLLHFLTLVTGDLMRESKRWLRRGVFALLLVLVGLGALGALLLVHQGVQQQLCWQHPTQLAQSGWAVKACNWLSGLRGS